MTTPIINNAAFILAPPAPGDTRERNAFGVLTGFGKAYSAHYNLEDRRKAATFAGTRGKTRFDCSPHRYGKGMVLSIERDKTGPDDIWKDDDAWLAEALGGKWARGHQPGYRIAPGRALQWRTLYLAGFTAYVPCFGRPNLHFYRIGTSDEKLSLKEALAQIAAPLQSS